MREERMGDGAPIVFDASFPGRSAFGTESRISGNLLAAVGAERLRRRVRPFVPWLLQVHLERSADWTALGFDQLVYQVYHAQYDAQEQQDDQDDDRCRIPRAYVDIATAFGTVAYLAHGFFIII